MEHYYGKKLPDKCTHQTFLETAIENVTNSIRGYMVAGISKQEAIAKTKIESCAGPAVWKIVLSNLN